MGGWGGRGIGLEGQVTVQRGDGVGVAQTMQWSVEPRLPCPPWVVYFVLVFFFLLSSGGKKNPLNVDFKNKIKNTYIKTQLRWDSQ